MPPDEGLPIEPERSSAPAPDAKLVESGAYDLDEEDDGDEGFRRLVERSLLADDHGATRELVEYVVKKIRPKVRKVPLPEQDDVAQELLMKAWLVARAAMLRPVVKLRNYTFTAVNNEYVRQVNRLIRQRRIEPVGLGEELERAVVQTVRQAPFEEHSTKRLHMLRLLERMRSKVRTTVERQLVDTLTLMYAFGIDLSEAFNLLNFTTRERNTLCKALARWRDNPRSILDGLSRYEEGEA